MKIFQTAYEQNFENKALLKALKNLKKIDFKRALSSNFKMFENIEINLPSDNCVFAWKYETAKVETMELFLEEFKTIKSELFDLVYGLAHNFLILPVKQIFLPEIEQNLDLIIKKNLDYESELSLQEEEEKIGLIDNDLKETFIHFQNSQNK